jgi:hypothetical protein
MAHSPAYRRILYRMGYYEYQHGLIYHHLKEEGGWNNHLKRCRDFILKAVEHYKPSVVTALGSGWLLDFPLREIVDTVAQINLVDIIHPPEVRNQVAGMKNVVLKEDDVSGGLIEEIWRKAGHRFFFNKLKTLEEIEIPEYQPEFETGLVISLNILTQIESLPIMLLKKRTSVGEQSYLNFRNEIQQKHINFLKKNKSVLITDLTEVVTEDSGKVSEIRSVLTELPRGSKREDWTWDFDLRKSDYFRKKSVFTVAALIL